MHNKYSYLFISIFFSVSVWALDAKSVLDRVKNETQLKVDEQLTILTSITEERNPSVVHALCVTHNQEGVLSHVLNFDSSLNELSYIDEQGSQHISNKQFWPIKEFFQSTEMVSFFGMAALKGKILNQNVLPNEMNGVELSYLYSLSQYKQKVLYLSRKDGGWKLYHKVQTNFLPVKSLFVKGRKNFLGFIEGIEDIIVTVK